ncbi:MAG: porin family protein [Bacteroidia bacterium]|nr:porin family protein [Bacteroidia bacterium]
MVRCLAVLFLLTMATAAQAQRAEIGFGLGTLNYSGDLVRGYNFGYSQPAGTIIYRSNLSSVVSVRASVMAGKLKASDRNPIDAAAGQRNASFNIFLFEASTGFEYHFLNWRDEKRFLRFSPYFFAGLGLFGMSGNEAKPVEYSNVQLSIPFGAGVKYVLNPKWYVSLEFGIRKTFFDYLDNVSDVNPQNVKNYQYGNPFDNDNYYFLGVTLTRTFYTIPCPRSPY